MGSTEPYRGDASKVARTLGEDKATVEEATRVLTKAGRAKASSGGSGLRAFFKRGRSSAAADHDQSEEDRDAIVEAARKVLGRLDDEVTTKGYLRNDFNAEFNAARTRSQRIDALKKLTAAVDQAKAKWESD